MENYEINPRKGISGITFSMDKHAVKSALGNPDICGSDTQEISLSYSNIGLTFLFSEGRITDSISSIEIENSDSILWGEKVLGEGSSFIKELLSKNDVTSIREENDQYGEYIFCDDLGIAFEFEDGLLEVVVIYNENGSELN